MHVFFLDQAGKSKESSSEWEPERNSDLEKEEKRREKEKRKEIAKIVVAKRKEAQKKKGKIYSNLRITLNKKYILLTDVQIFYNSESEKQPLKRGRPRKDEKETEKRPTKKLKNEGSEKKATRKRKEGYRSIRTRSSPKQLYVALNGLTKEQQMVVEQMGFGKLLTMRLEGVAGKIGYYVVDNFDEKKMEINLENGEKIKITKDVVHEMLGIPKGKQDLYALPTQEKLCKENEKWKGKHPKNITPADCVKRIAESKETGWGFKLDFLILFTTTMGECFKSGICKLDILQYLNKETDLSNIDWCGFVLNILKSSKNGWKRDDKTSYYIGPLILLVVSFFSKL